MKKILLQGNIALCEGAIAAGCDAYFGYPITPQNEVSTHMSRRMPELKRVFLQAESELAAINMVLGVSATGKRAMTSSSSPGISLKQEGISYLAGCELPCVIANVTRGGPGLGNISGSQADYFQSTKGGGHGDYRLIVLAPSSPQEMYDFAYKAFALAEKYRNPVLILSDGYVGQMMEPIKISNFKSQISNIKKDWILDGCAGREPRKIRSLLMADGELEAHNWKLNKKYETIKKNEVKYETYNVEKADTVIVAFGISSRVCTTVLQLAKKDKKKIGMFRPITLWPFPEKELSAISKKVKRMVVVEMNLGQMVEDVRLAANGRIPVDFIGRPGGAIFTAEEIYEFIKKRI
ncbi:MAG: 3-methyl-2-oxobutanoate dehydrogenase subunit VorB [Elusimicrobia bacterium RIFOXYA2_FULL_39_19]|nr:MAG: 3-methyl-2-oxobutanoate dehydrogenase subunit VorB [Elusimicrobia bacterium RIFOXYA2_FULL_39_19]